MALHPKRLSELSTEKIIEMFVQANPRKLKLKRVGEYVDGINSASFENIFKKLGNFERSLNYLLDILKICSLQYLPSSSLLKMWNDLPLDLKRSNSLSN